MDMAVKDGSATLAQLLYVRAAKKLRLLPDPQLVSSGANLFQSSEDLGTFGQVSAFLSRHELVELTCPTIREFDGKCALYCPPAQRACKIPTGSAGVVAMIIAVQSLFRGRRAQSEFTDLRAAGLSTAFLEFPTVLRCHRSHCSHILNNSLY